jgi:lipoate-protein ligase B
VDVAAPTLDPGPARDPVAGGPLEARWLGRIGYRDAWALQHELVERRIAGEIPDQLLLLEHPAVLTLGRNAEDGHVRASAEELAARGIEVIRVERGGEVTYHGPGQLVAYPILALSRRGLLLRPMVRALEGAMVDTCLAFGVVADRRDGHPGCWCDVVGDAPRKIGALGIRVERGVSYHGIALNIDPDLADFDLIDPCGMPEVVSTSIARELRALRKPPGEGFRGDARRGIGRDPHVPEPSVERAARVFARAFAERLGAELIGGGAGANLGDPTSGRGRATRRDHGASG